jgi:hypothetical protein
MAETPASQQIWASRDQIRNQIIELYKSYMELENVDLTKSSWNSFIIEILSTITTNVMFYQVSTYKEFFLTRAQLPESILNLAAFLGYNGSNASASTVNAFIVMPFGFDDANTEFAIPEGFKFKGEGDILFSTDYITTITVTNNASVRIIRQQGNSTFDVPVTIDIDANEFAFSLPVRQFEIKEDEFIISEDLQTYQFSTIDVPLPGQIGSLDVDVTPPTAAGSEQWIQVSSLFLMDENTKGYIARRTDTGLTITFGNGLIGVQPDAGSKIEVTTELTDGVDGNIITGKLNTGEGIYNTTLAGVTEVVQYTVTNLQPATGGSDEESLEEIRRNSIINLTALERLISEEDYQNADVIIDGSPLGQNSLPVLKRSDLTVNEITLFTTLLFLDDIVPTRNIKYTFPATTFIPRNTILTQDGDEYYTLYDMSIDIINSVADYTYIMFEVEQVPTLVTSYGSTYNLYSDLFYAIREGGGATFHLSYHSDEVDFDLAECEMEILETGAKYNMVNDSSATEFILIFPDNTVIPSNENTYYFTISHPTEGLIAQYQATFIFRQDLKDFVMSDAVTDGTSYVVYDIPTVEKEYYDGINQRDFETQTMQVLLSTVTFKDYKMLTDFVNLKFANTTGQMNNMQLNPVTIPSVIDILSDPPTSCSLADRYIVLNGTGAWLGHDNDIATCNDATAVTWVFTTPKTEQMAFVTNKNLKYLYAEAGWIVPAYAIPLQISLDVFKTSTYTGSTTELSDSIKSALLSAFEDRFGINIDLYRSEIIDVVQEVTGVEHCRLITPESSIFFDFDINDFTQEQLLSYGPEYVFFEEDDISIRIF